MDLSRIIMSVVAYVAGIATGYILKTMIIKEASARDYKTIVLLVVTTIWTISMLVEIVNPAYHTNPMVHGLMGSIVGFFYKFEPKK